MVAFFRLFLLLLLEEKKKSKMSRYRIEHFRFPPKRWYKIATRIGDNNNTISASTTDADASFHTLCVAYLFLFVCRVRVCVV